MPEDLFTEPQPQPRARRRTAGGARSRRTRATHTDIERRYQVFVSSTYRDLIGERQEVIQALLELECIPAGMELFLAANEDQWSLIESVIDDCDYYVLIIGGRYGSLTEDGISYTEREYDYAVKRGMPILAFLHEDPDALPVRSVDADPALTAKLDAFRTKARSRPIRTFATPDGLGSVVSRSLVRLMKTQPGEGWVRGRFAANPEGEAEAAELRARVAELELLLARSNDSAASRLDKADLEALDETVSVSYTYSGKPRTVGNIYRGVWEYRWAHLFKLLGPALMDEATETQLLGRLASDIQTGVYGFRQVPRIFAAAVTLESGAIDEIKLRLRAMGLIEPGRRKRQIVDNSTYWRLSDHGEVVLMHMASTNYGKDPARPSNVPPERDE